MPSLKEYRKTKEWKERRDKWVKDKKCKWCGSTEHLSPHHPIPYGNMVFWNLRRKMIDAMMKDMGLTVTNYVYYKTGGFNTKEKKYISLRDIGSWHRNNNELFEKLKDKARKEVFEKYKSLRGCEPMCKKCHYNIEKGLKLCSYCKKRYYRERYNGDTWIISCKECIPKVEEEDKELEEAHGGI